MSFRKLTLKFIKLYLLTAIAVTTATNLMLVQARGYIDPVRCERGAACVCKAPLSLGRRHAHSKFWVCAMAKTDNSAKQVK